MRDEHPGRVRSSPPIGAAAPEEPVAPRFARSRIARLFWVFLGVVLGQAALYGPALVGQKVLLPLDILRLKGNYIPVDAAAEVAWPENMYLSDLVFVAEPARRFAHRELAAGRFPAWDPAQYSGVPFTSARFSPFLLLEYAFESPLILPWVQLCLALIAGFGAYAFCRRVSNLSFWPSAVAGWCYPLTGFFVFWQGYPTSLPICWLPWLLLAVHDALQGGRRFAAAKLALVTALVVVSGALDVAALVLMTGALFGAWSLYEARRAGPSGRRVWNALATLGLSTAAGLMLAAPYVFPMIEYARTGDRMVRRAAGKEERPPIGLAALPQCVLPDMYGRFGETKRGSFRTTHNSQQESTAAGYAGLLATLFLAPLAWLDRSRRRSAWFWCGATVLALSWSLDMPGIVAVLRSPVLNSLSYNRWVFVAAFALTILAAIGLEVIVQRSAAWRTWMWIPCLVSLALTSYCSLRVAVLPEPIRSELQKRVAQGASAGWIHDLDSVRLVQDDFRLRFAIGAGLGAAAVLAWLFVRYRRTLPRVLPALVVAVILVDLLWFGHDRSVMADPALYYPPVPTLEALATAEPGRVVGVGCFPANLAGLCGLRDVRGYDAVDPATMLEVLMPSLAPGMLLPYALTQWATPKNRLTAEGDVELTPLLDLLGVRHVICRGPVAAGARPLFQSPDYWIASNPKALPRALVPRRCQVVADPAARISMLGAKGFDPREIALVEEDPGLPAECRGDVRLVAETPTAVTLEATMDTPGLVVLADAWNRGWRANVAGHPATILRVDHVVRGVVLPAGVSRIEFRYEPLSFRLGLWCAAAAALALAAWSGRRSRAQAETIPGDRARPGARSSTTA